MIWYRLHLAIVRLADWRCRHPVGVVCAHRQYEHDQWLRGYGRGLTAGKANVEAKWLGSISGDGPYANYPAPRAAQSKEPTDG